MKPHPRRFAPTKLARAGAVSVGVLLLTPATHGQIPCGGYEVTAIVSMEKCPPFGIPPVVPLGINEQGWMVGYFNPCVVGPNRAFLWTPDDGLVVIPMPAGTTQSRALAISGSKIVGTHVVTGDEFGDLGFLYDFETDEFTSLGTLPRGNTSFAQSINSAGEIVGSWGDVVKGPFPQAFIWRDGEMVDINPDFGTPKSDANDINSNGLVTGWMGTGNIIDSHAFIWDDGRVTELPFVPAGITSEGECINSYGDVAGRGWFFDPKLDVFVWRAFAFIDGEAMNLGTLPGFTKSHATGISDDQIIVGVSWTTSVEAFIWKDGEMGSLNDVIPPELGLDFSTARGINQAGQIAATAHSDDLDATVGVLLSPVNQDIPGDIDNDGQVGVKDLLFLLGVWGPCP